MPDRRPAASLALGLAGLGAGVVGGAASLPSLGVVAGLCAVGAGAMAWLSAASPSASPLPTGYRSDTSQTIGPDTVVGPGGGRVAPARHETGPAGTSEGKAQAGGEFDVAPVVSAAQPDSEVVAPDGIAWGSDGQLLVDPVTALYTESYLLVALDARIAAARRRLRPVSVVMVEVVRGVASGRPTPSEPKIVADAVRATLREADTASRMNDGRYALVLEDTPENGAIWTVERLRSCLVDENPDFTVWAGVACYPAHAFNLDEILVQATTALEAAKEWRQDRIEVATAE